MTLSLYAIACPPDFWNSLLNCLDGSPASVSLPLNLGEVDTFLDHFVERGKLTKLLHYVDQLVGRVVDFCLGVEASQTKADRTVRDIVAQPQGLQYIRWLQCCRGAGRTAGNRDIVDAHQQRLAFHVNEAHI